MRSPECPWPPDRPNYSRRRAEPIGAARSNCRRLFLAVIFSLFVPDATAQGQNLATFLQKGPWSDLIDPYEDTDREASTADAYLDFDLYEKLQLRIIDDSPNGLGAGSDREPWSVAGTDSDPASWNWQWLPEGLVYSPPMAAPKESRLSLQLFNERDDGWLYDVKLGTTTGIFRYGSAGSKDPFGFQMDFEGSAQLRLDLPEELDVRSADYRAGIPLTFAVGRWRSRAGYYHISSHLGDEFLLKNPGFPRLNFVRDVLYVSQSVNVTPSWRLYGDLGWAFHSDIANEWEVQFGTEYVSQRSWHRGARPFWAVNGQIREELDFGGTLDAQLGWLWHAENGRRLRVGVHYQNGHSNQWSFFRAHEDQIGVGLWIDR
jgi:hypothetical protein